MNYPEVLEYLDKVALFGSSYGLGKTRAVLRRLPGSGSDIPYIQVAGTNGKGSTAHFLSSILGAGGYRVGLFTSPHMVDVRERICIDGGWIPEIDFAAAVTTVKEIAQSLLDSGGIQELPTYFEYTLLVALYFFSREAVDFAILEVGLGGRLDATTAVTPVVSVITGISRDHTAVLGTRISDIAREKAGIIKKGVPVVCGCSAPSTAYRIIRGRARELEAPFFPVIGAANRLEVEPGDNGHGYRCRYETRRGAYNFELIMNGEHQARNAAIALKVLEQLEDMGVEIPAGAASAGLASTRIPCRIECLDTAPPVILDGGHNPESVRALAEFLRQQDKRDLTLIFGVLEDKNYRAMARSLVPYIRDVVLTEPLSPRALPAERLVPLFRGTTVSGIRVCKDPAKALDLARGRAGEILITGSFYLVGEMRRMIIHGGQHGPGKIQSH